MELKKGVVKWIESILLDSNYHHLGSFHKSEEEQKGCVTIK